MKTKMEKRLTPPITTLNMIQEELAGYRNGIKIVEDMLYLYVEEDKRNKIMKKIWKVFDKEYDRLERDLKDYKNNTLKIKRLNR